MTLIELLRIEFEKRLERKTGWGRTEVLVEFDKACINAMIQHSKERGIILD